MRNFFIRSGGHFFASLSLVVISGWVAKQAYSMGLGRLHSPGPGFVVFIASILLGVLALHMLAKSLSGSKEVSRPSTPTKKRWNRVVSVFLVLVAYVVFLNKAGYLVVTLPTLFFLFAVLKEGKKRWALMIAAAALISGVTYVVFSCWFQLQLPKGLIHWL